MTARRPRGLFAVLTCGLVLLSFGCGGSKPTKVIVPKDTLPLNDTVQKTMLRFEATYEFQDLPKYANLLASDFRYTFSQASDPLLVQTYPNWGKDDEVATSQHLFEGFTNSLDEVVPAASKIEMDLYGVQPTTDVEHQDSTAYYQKVVVSRVVMSIEVPGSPEPTVYNIDARHEFYLVRGDAAVLDAGQEARADRWYIRRWDDLSPPNPSPVIVPSGPTAYTTTSWGRVRARYRS
jgi:hypothetical protein